MSEPFFYCPTLGKTGTEVTLTGNEARHAGGARRLRPGDRVTLFNGSGLLAAAELAGIHERGRAVVFRLQATRQLPPPRPAVHLACALPKGDRLATLLDMATQLGMTGFTALDCEHNVVKPGTGAIDRWQRICLEACKQSRRAWLPVFGKPDTPESLTRAVVAAGGQAWIAHPDGAPPGMIDLDAARDQYFLVGPEGGFTGDEVARAEDNGAKRIGLGEGILRVETAAVALLAAARLCALGNAG